MMRLEFPEPVAYRNAGYCSQCGGGENLVGLDFVVEYEGAVALCRGCIADAAALAGFILTADGAARLATAEARAEAAEAQAAEADRLLAGLQAAVSRARKTSVRP